MKISQREARRLRKRVYELERILDAQKSQWSSEWPSSTCIGGINVDPATHASIKTARLLKHAVVVTVVGENRIGLFAEGLK